MRQWINIMESHDWFSAGKPVDMKTYDGWHHLEGDEFEYDWRLCMVPANILFPSLLDPEESNNRIEAIDKWANGDIEASLVSSPPTALYHNNEFQILDGNHRTHFAKTSGLKFIPMLVGIPK